MGTRLETGIFELIGKDEAVAATEYSASVGVALDAAMDGEIKAVALYSYETGTGAVQVPAGTLYFLDADPATAAGDAALAAAGAEHRTTLGTVDIATSDWKADANGAVASAVVSIPFQVLATVYVVFRPAAGATTINSAAGDDEVIDCRFWYEKANG